jgi:hypothetical protein
MLLKVANFRKIMNNFNFTSHSQLPSDSLIHQKKLGCFIFKNCDFYLPPLSPLFILRDLFLCCGTQPLCQGFTAAPTRGNREQNPRTPPPPGIFRPQNRNVTCMKVPPLREAEGLIWRKNFAFMKISVNKYRYLRIR